jgi:hypothetical protein
MESSLVADRECLDWFLLAFVAMCWIIHLAASFVHDGHDQRDKSLFRLDCLWLRDILRRVAPQSAHWRSSPSASRSGSQECQGESYVGGTMEGKLRLHDPAMSKQLTQTASAALAPLVHQTRDACFLPGPEGKRYPQEKSFMNKPTNVPQRTAGLNVARRD